jgi:hypothetical protein
MDFNFAGGVFDDTARRKQLSDSIYNGIDYIEVDATPGETNQRILRIYFIPPGPSPTLANKISIMLEDLDGVSDAFLIEGGERIRHVRVLEARRVEGHIELLVDRPGDFSDYTLRITYDGRGGADNYPLDLFYAEVPFNFKAGCPARFDCHQPLICPPEPMGNIFVDYMAKDFESFRQAMIDLLPKLIPNWSERRAADLGMTLLELLAYVGDQLSYYQDAVANEAYLETSRQRISVRRHARLIDYAMHDGLSARTIVHLRLRPKGTAAGVPAVREMTLAAEADEDRIIRILTVPEGLNLPHLIPSNRESEALAAAGVIFEIHLRRADTSANRPAEALFFHEALDDLRLYNWGNQSAYLPAGATSADILGELAYDADTPGFDQSWRLKAGDLILLEEVLDPYSGEALLADPQRRHVVRLTRVETVVDKLAGELGGGTVTITRLFWDTADALPFRLWISHVTDDGTAIPQVSVAHGNLAVANYGRTFEEWYPRQPEPGPDKGGIGLGQRAFTLRLQEGPLAHSIPSSTLEDGPAIDLMKEDPRLGFPAVHRLDSITKDSSGAERSRSWQIVTPSLLNSDRFAEHAIVETDNNGRAELRFGNNDYGSMPDDNSFFHINYRVGIGSDGNIGADKLTYLVLHDDVGSMQDIVEIRNPLPAWGGSSPESIEEVKRLAPAAFRAAVKRAVTEEDYALVAELHPQVARALARFRWTGSWHTVFIRVDPKGTTDLDDTLRDELVDWVGRFTMTGYDIEIIDPFYINLELTLDICVEPGYFSGDIERAVTDILSNTVLPDGQLGFFHPDNFTFGQRLYLSRIYAAVEEAAGVQSVEISGIHRLDSVTPEEETQINLQRGFIDVGEFKVIRLDNSVNFPENGILHLNMLGGIA